MVFRSFAGAGKTSERPRVDEHGIEYADEYIDNEPEEYKNRATRRRTTPQTRHVKIREFIIN